MRKILFTVLLSVISVFCALGLSGCFDSSHTHYERETDGTIIYGYYEYSGECTVVGCEEGTTELIIPAEFNGMAVVGISGNAFQKSADLKSVSIPETVTEISGTAFGYCTNIENLTVAEENPVYASIENCIIETGTKTLIAGCKTSVIPAGGEVTAIAEYAFLGQSEIEQIIIPASLTEISETAFKDCTGLKKYIADESNANYFSADGVLYERAQPQIFLVPLSLSGRVAVPEGITEIEGGAFANRNNLTEITIPESVTEIGEGAFAGCSGLESITLSYDSVGFRNFGYIFGKSEYDGCIATNQGTTVDFLRYYDTYYVPEALKRITLTGNSLSDYAFVNCANIEEVILSQDITEIGDYAFYNCYALKDVCFPESVKKIGMASFQNCRSFESLTIPDGIEELDRTAFYNCVGLKNLTLPASAISSFKEAYGVKKIPLENVTVTMGDIPDNAFTESYFAGGYIRTVTLSEGVTSIGFDAFRGCTGIEKIYWNAVDCKTTGLSTFAFSKRLTEVVFGGGVCTIPADAFGNCENITTLTLSDGITSIGEKAFYKCIRLTRVTIPAKTNSIGADAFGGCNKLVEVYNRSGLNILKGTEDFGGVGLYARNLYTPKNGESKISISGDGYIFFKDTDGVYLLGSTDIKNQLNLPDGIGGGGYKIFDNAFYEYGAESVNIPDGVIGIGDRAFYNCKQLKEVTIGDGTASIGSYAFAYCNHITAITLGGGLICIGGFAFDNCTLLKDISIPDSVAELGEGAFFGCRDLDLTDYGNALYLGNRGNPYIILIKAEGELVTNCTVNADTKFIHYGAFRDCASLESVIIPEGVVTVGDYAFRNCANLSYVKLPDSVTKIGFEAFLRCASLPEINIPEKLTEIGNSAFYGCDGLKKVYYKGAAEGWAEINIGYTNTGLTRAERYYYSETQPSGAGNFWHYVDGEIAEW